MKRICAVLLVLSLSLSGLGNFTLTVWAAEEEESSEVNVLTLAEESELEENYDTLNEVNVIYTEEQVFSALDVEDVKEVLDNGTDFLVADADIVELEEAFEAGTTVADKEADTVACYITTENSEYTIMPVYADVMYDEDDEISDEQYSDDTEALYTYVVESLRENVVKKELTQDTEDSITAEEVYTLAHDKTNEDILSQVTEEELAELQTATLIGNSFVENSKFVYFYKEGTASGTGTEYAYSTSTTKAGWSKMGSISLALYGIKVKTVDDTTFDNVYSVVVASGLNDKYVKRYDVNVSVSELASNVIVDESVTSSTSSSTTGKLATSVTAAGNVTSSSYETYAFNPGGMTVSTDFSEKYVRSWSFTPATYDADASWRVRPGILLKKTNGTTAAVTASVSVDYFQVSGGVRNYTIKDTVKCSIRFINHSEA